MDSHYRDYIRTSSWNIVAKISDDNTEWIDVQVPNISASGLLFLTNKPYRKGDVVWFSLDIAPIVVGPNFHIKMTIKAAVKGNREEQDGMSCFAVKFTDISVGDQIRLDELVQKTVATYGLSEETLN